VLQTHALLHNDQDMTACHDKSAHPRDIFRRQQFKIVISSGVAQLPIKGVWEQADKVNDCLIYGLLRTNPGHT
jgi:hypothetical protein